MRVHVAGCILIAPVIIGLMLSSIVAVLLSIVYGALLWYSPVYIPQARSFWRAWHRVNFRIINAIKLDY